MSNKAIGLLGEYYLPSEVARILGVHIGTIRRWAKEGKIAYQIVEVGKRQYRVFSKKTINEIGAHKENRDQFISQQEN